MNRSFTKINHMQKVNMLLENRMLQYKTLIKEDTSIHITNEDEDDIVFKTSPTSTKKFYYSCSTKKVQSEGGGTESPVLTDGDKKLLDLKCQSNNKAV